VQKLLGHIDHPTEVQREFFIDNLLVYIHIYIYIYIYTYIYLYISIYIISSRAQGSDLRRAAVAQFYLQQIRLLSELCVGRNNDAVDAISTEFSFELLVALFRDESRSKEQIRQYATAAVEVRSHFML